MRELRLGEAAFHFETAIACALPKQQIRHNFEYSHTRKDAPQFSAFGIFHRFANAKKEEVAKPPPDNPG